MVPTKKHTQGRFVAINLHLIELKQCSIHKIDLFCRKLKTP